MNVIQTEHTAVALRLAQGATPVRYTPHPYKETHIEKPYNNSTYAIVSSCNSPVTTLHNLTPQQLHSQPLTALLTNLNRHFPNDLDPTYTDIPQPD